MSFMSSTMKSSVCEDIIKEINKEIANIEHDPFLSETRTTILIEGLRKARKIVEDKKNDNLE